MEQAWKRIMEDLQTVRFRQETETNPYREANADCIRKGKNKDYITWNGFYRYGDILEPLWKEALATETRELFYDNLLHILTNLEIRNGISIEQYQSFVLKQQILRGQYGHQVQSGFLLLEEKVQDKIAGLLYRQKCQGENSVLYGEALITAMGDGVLYRDRQYPTKYLYYLGRKKEVDDEILMDMIKELFLPFFCEVEVFYEKCFGVIGSSKSMELI